MNSILFAGDLHLSSRTPESRIDNYGDTVLKKLESLLNIAISTKSDVVIFTGDFFESYYEPISYINKVVEVLSKFKDKNIRILSLIGNHDLPYNNMEYFSSTPLSLLFKSRLVERLDYIADDSVEIFGLHFSEKDKLSSFKTSPNKTSILVMHYAFNNTVPGESINAPDLMDFDIIIAGHDHMFYEPHVVTEEGPLVARPGSFTRQTKDSYNLTRKIIVYSWSNTKGMRLIELPGVEPAGRVFSNKVFIEGSLSLYGSRSLANLFTDDSDKVDSSYNIFNIIKSLTIPVTKESKDYVIKFLRSKGIVEKSDT